MGDFDYAPGTRTGYGAAETSSQDLQFGSSGNTAPQGQRVWDGTGPVREPAAPGSFDYSQPTHEGWNRPPQWGQQQQAASGAPAWQLNPNQVPVNPADFAYGMGAGTSATEVYGGLQNRAEGFYGQGQQALGQNMQARQQQQQALDYYGQMMAGNTPSVAALQQQQGLESALRSQQAMAAGARGGGIGGAQRSAAMNVAGMQQAGVNQAAMLRANEQARAAEMFGTTATGIRTADQAQMATLMAEAGATTQMSNQVLEQEGFLRSKYGDLVANSYRDMVAQETQRRGQDVGYQGTLVNAPVPEASGGGGFFESLGGIVEGVGNFF